MRVPDLKIQIPEDEIDEMLALMKESLTSGMLVESNTAKKMSDQMRKITGSKFCIPIANGGAALEVALKYQRSKRSGKVICPTNTFAATALAIERAGFENVFCESDSRYLGLNFAEAKKMIDNDPQVRGVVVVHIGGMIDPDLPEFIRYCAKNGVWVLEDAAHAIGSRLKGKHAGTFGYAGTFSFFATKTVGSPEGGAIVTEDEELAKFAEAEKNYGKIEKWKHDIVQKGWNYRISELSAAVIYVQLKHLDEILYARQQIVDAYEGFLGAHFDFIRPSMAQDSCSWYKLLIATPVAAKLYYEALYKVGIKCPGTVFDPPLHKMPVFESKEQFPNTVEMCTHHLALPIYPGLSLDDVEYVSRSLYKVNKELLKKKV